MKNILVFIKKIDGFFVNCILLFPKTGFFQKIMLVSSLLGSGGIVWFGISFLIIVFSQKPSRRKAAFLNIVTLIIILVINDLFLKRVFQRQRPIISSFPFFGKGYSFPSGHTALTIGSLLTLFPVLSYFQRLLVGFLGVLIIFSRLYFGFHYFSDILVGLLEGGMVAFLVSKRFFVLILLKTVSRTLSQKH